MVLAGIARDSDPARSLSYYDHIISHFGEIKNNPQMRRYEVRAHAGAVYPLLRLGRIDSARERLKIAFAGLKELKLYPRDEVAAGSEADDVLRASAEIEARTGNFAKALEIDNALLAQIMASKPEPEDDLADALDLSTLFGSLAAFSQAAHHTEEAAAFRQRQLQLWQHWDRKLPGNAFVQRQRDAATAALSAPLTK